MELNRVRYFINLAETLDFTVAARLKRRFSADLEEGHWPFAGRVRRSLIYGDGTAHSTSP
jgi:hypothetical protein